MKLALGAAALLCIAGAYGLGVVLAPAPPSPLVVARGARVAAAQGDVTAAGAAVGVALIAAALPSSMGPPPERGAGEASLPAWRAPPLDPAYFLRRELTAVVQAPGGAYQALLTRGEGGAQVLRPGDAYLDGWRLRGLTLTEAVLAKGGAVRRVDLFDPNRPPPEPAPPQQAPPRALSEIFPANRCARRADDAE